MFESIRQSQPHRPIVDLTRGPQHDDGNGSGDARITATTRRRRVLIVDDEKDLADLIAELLSYEGYKTLVVTSSDAALGAAPPFGPDVALLDLGLPKVDGYSLAPMLRGLCPGVFLIAVTGYQREPHRLREAGFNHHFQKPLDLNHLTRVIGPPRVVSDQETPQPAR